MASPCAPRGALMRRHEKRSRSEEWAGDAALIPPAADPKGSADAAPTTGRHAGEGGPGLHPGDRTDPPARSWLTMAPMPSVKSVARGRKKPQWSAARRGARSQGRQPPQGGTTDV